jgi:4-hydroxybenzoate polyprenyltransferase
MGTAFLSVWYMMPFNRNGKQLYGLRNNLFLKNIVLSITWALSTVIFPLLDGSQDTPGMEIAFMFIRRFFFIYALTVIYDLRDLEADRHAGMETIALRFGNRTTRLWSFAALLVFALLVIVDPYLKNAEMRPLSIALLLSAFAGAMLIGVTKTIHQKPYFPVLVDAAMAIQFLLVVLLHQS